MRKSDDRILTTHAGSLVRTPEIVEAMMKDYVGRPLEEEELGRVLAGGVEEVVKKQAEIGLDVIDDGEFGKKNWINYLVDRMDGVESSRLSSPEEQSKAPVYPDQQRFGSFYREHVRHEYTQWLPDTPTKAEYIQAGPAFNGAVCTGSIRYDTGPLARDIANFKAALRGVSVKDAFMPVAAPCSAEVIRNEHYASQEEFLFAVADALSVEYRMIVDAGFLLQVDDAMLPMQCVMQFRNRPFEDFLKYAQIRVEALNHALKGIPEERVRYHICFGSHNVPHMSDVSLEAILDVVLGVHAQAYSIEASNPRHEHEWTLWRDRKLPDGKILIPGVVGHATNIVEHPELVAMRITNFAKLVGRENVIAGTDCGFSQGWNILRTHPEVQWAKLEALVSGARLASDRLWAGQGARRA